MSRALFPGRFQPFHLGHLSVVERVLREHDEIVIAIGSAQEGYTCSNPFTASERMEMIDSTLKYYGYSRDQYWLVPVPDIHKPLAWTSYVLALVPRIDVVVTGNPHIQHIYEWLGVRVARVELVSPSLYNGTVIRKLMASGAGWEELVPKPIADFINRVGGVERVRSVCAHGVS